MVTGEQVTRAVDFRSFFADEQGPLLRYCWGLTLDRESASDVAQEAMARAWAEWERFDSDDHARAWLRTVALNLVRSRWRRDRTAASTTLAPVATGGAAEPVDPDLVAALRSLPERQREAVVLHHLGDLSVADCAEVMGASVPTVKSHLQRGRARLAELLGVDDAEVPR